MLRPDPKFTPGPWNTNFTTVGGEAHDWHITAPEHGSINPICERGRGDIRSDAEERANARLIAAAPDLYEALKALHEATRMLPAEMDEPGSPQALARAALARADGAGQ